MRIRGGLAAGLLCAEFAVAGTARADARVTVCGKDVWPGDPRVDLGEALQIGGRITFACSGTIRFSRTHPLTKDVAIDGQRAVTLDGNGHRMFGLGSGRSPRVSFTGVRIVGGRVGPSGLPGGVVSGEGFVALLDGTTISQSEKPVWVMAGGLDIRTAVLSDNVGPVVTVSEGELNIAAGTAFIGNAGLAVATGPGTHVRIADAQFSRNGGANFGGTSAPACDVVIVNSRFVDNTAAGDGGAFATRCTLAIEHTTFDHNAAGRHGGAVFLGADSRVTMRAVQFADNQAAGNGGAVAGVWEGSGGVDLRIRDARFKDNRAAGVGGAVFVAAARRLDVALGSFVGNAATKGGGALYVIQTPFTVGNSAFLKNRAGQTGGAIESYCVLPPGSRVANAIFGGNVAAEGAAFYGTRMTFINATLAANGDAPVRQGRACGGRSAIAFANTILEGGLHGACAGADALQVFDDLGHNLQFPGRACGLSIPTAYAVLGPLFVPIRPFSPAGGAGDNATCRAPPVGGRDVYGAHRPQGAACSIGAVEGDLSQLVDRLLKRRRGATRAVVAGLLRPGAH